MIARVVIALIAPVWVTTAHAQGAEGTIPAVFDAPWTDVAPEIDREHDRVHAAAVGMPDERLGRLSARRTAARRDGEVRARQALHRWADDCLAQIRASAAIATALHRAIDRSAEVLRARALADGGAVIEVAIPLSQLRAVIDQRGLPWSR